MKYKTYYQRGISVYLAMMMMVLSLTVILGLSTLFFKQIKIVRGIGDSVVAFYAADTGIEKLIYQDEQCRQNPADCTTTLAWACQDDCSGMATSTVTSTVGSAQYMIKFFTQGASTNVLQSTGIFRESRRAIYVTREF